MPGKFTNDFVGAFDYVVGREGVFSDDPDDTGNWTGGKAGAGEMKGTKYGISAAAYPTLDIKNLTQEEARLIYRRDYWDKAHCDALPAPVAFCVFDCAVNQGVGRAIRCLQRAIGVNDDGKFGPHSRAAMARLSPEVAVEYFQAERIIEYAEAATWAKHRRGWMRRVIATAVEASQ
jgi:lysozyme family protein